MAKKAFRSLKSLLCTAIVLALLLQPLYGLAEAAPTSRNTFFTVGQDEFFCSISSENCASVEMYFRNVSNEEFQMLMNDPDALERKMKNYVITLPSEVEGCPVTSVANSFLAGIDTPAGIVLPETLRTIGDSAFRTLKNLKGEIVIPPSVSFIGERAFYGCPQLKSAIIPRSVTQIGEEAFCDCKQLTLTVARNSVGERHAVKYNIPYVYSNEPLYFEGELAVPVTCYVAMDDCGYLTSPSPEAVPSGSLAANTQVTVSSLTKGYAEVSFSGLQESVYIPMTNLLTLPVHTPETFGLHPKLYLDGWCLADFVSEQQLNQYMQDVEFWNRYLCQLDAYNSAAFDAQTLLEEAAVEYYKIYDEPLEAFASMDAIYDLEAMFDLSAAGSLHKAADLLLNHMPSSDTMYALARVFGIPEQSEIREKFENLLSLVDDANTLREEIQKAGPEYAPELTKKLTDEILPAVSRAFQAFLDKIQETEIEFKLPGTDSKLELDFSEAEIEIESLVTGKEHELEFEGIFGGILDKILKACHAETGWDAIKKMGSVSIEGLKLLDTLMPYFEATIHFTEMHTALISLNNAQQEALDTILAGSKDSYIYFVANAATDSDVWMDFFFDVIEKEVLEAIEDKVLPDIGVHKISTTLFSLTLAADGTTGRALDAYDAMLEKCLAQELLYEGVGNALAVALQSMPEYPTRAELIHLLELVDEYVRLRNILEGGSGTNSAFARHAYEEINASYGFEQGEAPFVPMLIYYQPEEYHP